MKMPLVKRWSRLLRGRLQSKVLSTHGVGVVADTRNGLFVVDPGDFNVSRQLLRRGEYDWDEVQRLVALCNADSRIVFAGAHVGALLVPIVRATGSKRVVAFEPSPRNHRLLQLNLALNRIEGVELTRAAVGPSPGTLRFTESRINTGNSRVSQAGEIEVPVVTLDAVLLADAQPIDLLVMDIEGFEVHALRGATQTLARTRHFYVEFAPEQLAEQGSRVDDFVAAATPTFATVQVFGPEPATLRASEFGGWVKDRATQRGLLLNLLFSKA